MDFMRHQAICMTCHKKNTVNNEVHRMNNLKTKIEQLVRNASDDEKQEARKRMIENPYLIHMCEYYEHCSYGLNCQDISQKINRINSNNREICEMLVLAGVIDKEAIKTYLPYLNGYYPKASRYVYNL